MWNIEKVSGTYGSWSSDEGSIQQKVGYSDGPTIKMEPGYVIRESERDENGVLVIKSIDMLELSIAPTAPAQTVEG